jgi:hypothetical protein
MKMAVALSSETLYFNASIHGVKTRKNKQDIRNKQCEKAKKKFTFLYCYFVHLVTFVSLLSCLAVIALGYGPEDRGSRVRFLAGAGNFSLHHRVQNGSGAYPASYQWVPGSLSVGVKRPGRIPDHSPPSSAEVKE